MNPPRTSAAHSYDPFSCYCPHSFDQHALIRCGHPNDRPPTHPLHKADDALHRVWCSECLKWCFSERDDCPIFKDPKMKLGHETGKGDVGDGTKHRVKAKKTNARM